MRRRAPRGLAHALEALISRVAPASTLADVQRVWETAVGPALAQRAEPVAERDGTLMIACESGVWAQEVQLMGAEIVEQVNAALHRTAVTAVRCRATMTSAARYGIVN